MTNQQKKLLIALVGIIIIAGIGWTIYSRRSTEIVNNGEVFVVGAPLVLSGDAAAWGENAQRGFDLAVEEINSSGGVNGKSIQVKYEDTAGEATNAVSAYQKLTTIGEVDALVGPLLQAELAAVAPLITRDKLPTVAPSYLPAQNRTTTYNPLLVWMDPTTEAGRMAEYVYGSGAKTASVISTHDSWEKEVAEGFANRFSSLGGRVIHQELLQPDATDVKAAVTKALNEQPAAVFVGTYFQFIPIIKTIKELGYRGKLYGIEVDSYLANETKPLSDGLRFIAPDFYTDEFIQKFKLKYGQEPGIPAGQAYDAMYLLTSFAKEERDREGILAAMSRFTSYSGVSGKLTVTPDGKSILPTAIFEIHNGQFVRLDD